MSQSAATFQTGSVAFVCPLTFAILISLEMYCQMINMVFAECSGLSSGEHISSMQDEAQILLYENIQQRTANTSTTSLTLRFGRLLLLLSALKRLNRTNLGSIQNSLLGLALNQLTV